MARVVPLRSGIQPLARATTPIQPLARATAPIRPLPHSTAAAGNGCRAPLVLKPAVARLMVWLVLLLPGVSCAEPADSLRVPFQLELGEPLTIPGVPPLQSYAHAHADVEGLKWLLVAGRHSGLHQFREPSADDPANDFPMSGDNDDLWVLDLEQRRVWHASLDQLPSELAEPLRASNCLSCQVGRRLILVGGYGRSETAETTGKMITFDTLTVLDVPAVVRAVMGGLPLAPHIQQKRDPAFRVTGGGMLPGYGALGTQKRTTDDGDQADGPLHEPQGCELYLLFGQVFDGMYSPMEGDSSSIFQQRYTEQVRRVSIRFQPELTIEAIDRYPKIAFGRPRPNDRTRPYHRRDLTVAPAISPEGQPRLAAYGGVFRPGQIAGYLEPIYVDQIGQASVQYRGKSYPYDTFLPGVERRVSQGLSHYECAHLAVHDGRSGGMFTVFFGGISGHWYDRESQRLVKDPVRLAPDGRLLQDGLPFIKSISLLAVDRQGGTAQGILPVELPGYLGAEASLLLDPRLPRHPNGVLQLERITQPTVIGHLYGGIKSRAPYTTAVETPSKGRLPTEAWNGLIPVVLIPEPGTIRSMPAVPAGE